MKRVYEVTFKDGKKLKTATVKGDTLIGALVTWAYYLDVYDNLVAVNEICFGRYNEVRYKNVKSKSKIYRA